MKTFAIIVAAATVLLAALILWGTGTIGPIGQATTFTPKASAECVPLSTAPFPLATRDETEEAFPVGTPLRRLCQVLGAPSRTMVHGTTEFWYYDGLVRGATPESLNRNLQITVERGTVGSINIY